MSGIQRVSFDERTWSRGTRGLTGPWATDKPFIHNLRYALDGALVPRPRWALIANLAAKTSQTARIFPARYFDTGTQTYQDGYVIADQVNVGFYLWSGVVTPYAFSSAGASGLSENSSITQIDATRWLVDEYEISLRGTGGFAQISVQDHQAAMESAFEPGSNSIVVQGSTIHQSRAFYWGYTEDVGGALLRDNRIYYSDAYDYGTFTSSEQFFDVDSSVEGVLSAGSSLFIWGITGDWFVLQWRGDPGAGTLNTIGRGRIPPPGKQPVRQDSGLYFMSSDKTTMVRVSEGGAMDDELFSHIGFDQEGEQWIANGSPTPTASSINNTLFVPNDEDFDNNENAVHWWNNAWTSESWEIGSIASKTVGTAELDGQEMLAVYLSGNWRIYRRDIVVASPEIDATSFYAEDPAARLYLPRITDPNRPIRVSKVIVDGRVWNNVGYTTPSLSVRAVDGDNTTTNFTLGPTSNLFANIPSQDNYPVRIVATPPSGVMRHTHFADVQLYDMHSLVIERVSVEYEVSNGRNR